MRCFFILKIRSMSPFCLWPSVKYKSVRCVQVHSVLHQLQRKNRFWLWDVLFITALKASCAVSGICCEWKDTARLHKHLLKVCKNIFCREYCFCFWLKYFWIMTFLENMIMNSLLSGFYNFRKIFVKGYYQRHIDCFSDGNWQMFEFCGFW